MGHVPGNHTNAMLGAMCWPVTLVADLWSYYEMVRYGPALRNVRAVTRLADVRTSFESVTQPNPAANESCCPLLAFAYRLHLLQPLARQPTNLHGRFKL